MIEKIEEFQQRRNALKDDLARSAGVEMRSAICLESIANSLIEISETLWILKNRR